MARRRRRGRVRAVGVRRHPGGSVSYTAQKVYGRRARVVRNTDVFKQGSWPYHRFSGKTTTRLAVGSRSISGRNAAIGAGALVGVAGLAVGGALIARKHRKKPLTVKQRNQRKQAARAPRRRRGGRRRR